MPLFSIITINRNNADGLRATMQSVLSQDFSDYEYIIIDGASTDGSVEVIREFLAVPEYASKISYWVSEPDSGIYNAMNKGIRHANGEFVNMMNSGDTMLPEVLERVAKIAAEHKGEVLYGAENQIKENEFIMTKGDSVSSLSKGMIRHQSCFVYTELHNKYGLYDETFKISGDWEMFLRFYINHVCFYYTNLIVCNFNLEGVSNTSKNVIKEDKLIRKIYELEKPKCKIVIKNILKFILPGGVWVFIQFVKRTITSATHKITGE